MEKVDDRLRETSTACLQAYDAWTKEQKDPSKREDLREAIHELRKVTSRLEIEMAVSEREEMSQKPLPIPSHRASRSRRKGGNEDADDSLGNKSESGDDSSNASSAKVERVKSRLGRRGSGGSSGGSNSNQNKSSGGE